MKRIIVCVMSTALLTAWSAVTRTQADKQKQGPAGGGDRAEAIAEGASQAEQTRRLREMLFGKDSGEQSPRPGGTTQPWQISWEAFCAELKRLYAKGVPPPEEIDAIFTGKQVTWEGHIAGINDASKRVTVPRGERFITLRMPECRVTGAGGGSAEVAALTLHFANQAEMSQSLNQIGLGDLETLGRRMWQRKDAYELLTQKVRFTATLEPVDLVVDKLPAVDWTHFTDEKGTERNQISIYTGRPRLLMGYANGSSR